MRLGIKLTALLAALVVVGSAVTLFVVTQITQHHFRDYIADQDAMQARHMAGSFASYFSERGSFSGAEALVERAPRDRRHGERSMMDEMHEMRGSMGDMPMEPAEPERVVLVEEDGTVAVDTSGAPLTEEIAARATEHGVAVMHGEEPVGWVLVGSMIDDSFGPQQEQFLASVRMAVIVSAMTVSLIALLLGSLFLAGLIRPLRHLTAAAQAVASGDLTVPVTTTADDEIGILADTFRSMHDTLAQAEEERRRMFRDLAHELRTPVTLLRGEIEAMLDGIYPVNADSLHSLHQEIAVLDRLIADVRTVSSMDSPGFSVQRSRTDIDSLLERVRKPFQREAADRGIGIAIETEIGLPEIEVDRERIRQVLANLITNAIRHSETADRITLGARRASAETPGVEITVEDNGKGIPEDERRAVFERLYRVDRARSRSTGGSGLGLAVARQIVEAHEGSIAAATADGGGTRVTVFLPLRSGDRVSPER